MNKAKRILERFKMWFKTYFKTPPTYYEELSDITLRIWKKVHESGDLRLLVISGDPDPEGVLKAWHLLNNQFLEAYGLDRETKALIKLKYRLAKALANYISTGQASFFMEVKLLREDIKAQNKKSGPSVTFTEIIANVESTLGFQLDEDKTTVRKFYSYLKKIKKESDDKKKNIKNFSNGKKNQ